MLISLSLILIILSTCWPSVLKINKEASVRFFVVFKVVSDENGLGKITVEFEDGA